MKLLSKRFVFIWIGLILGWGLDKHLFAMKQNLESVILRVTPDSPFRNGVELDCNGVSCNIITPENLKDMLFSFFDEQSTECQDVIGRCNRQLREMEKTQFVKTGLDALFYINSSLYTEFGLDKELNPEVFLGYSEKNPLWLLRDCDSKECPMCRFLPNVENQGRSVGLRMVVDHIRCNFSHEHPFSIVFFAPGRLLTEMGILTELAREGFKFRVVLIDKQWIYDRYDEYIEYLKSMRSGVLLDIADKFPFDLEWIREHTYRLAQCIQWLSVLNPNYKISFVIYSNVSAYVDDCKADSTLMSDAAISFDYSGDGGKIGYIASTDWMKLVTYSLRLGGFCYDCATFPDKHIGKYVIEIKQKIQNADWSILARDQRVNDDCLACEMNSSELLKYIDSFFLRDGFQCSQHVEAKVF